MNHNLTVCVASLVIFVPLREFSHMRSTVSFFSYVDFAPKSKGEKGFYNFEAHLAENISKH